MTDVDGLPVPRRYWAIGGISLGITLAVIDSAIANVALPTIASDLNAEPAHSIWVVNGYQLAITVALLPLSSLGDRIGYRNIYVPGLAIFTLASLACAMATSLELLTLARVVQGIGAAGIMSVSPALLRHIYPQSLLGRGLGINALVVALAAAAGPTIASAILAFAPWPWLFAVNIPIGIAAFALAAPSLPRTQNTSQKFDIISALLSAAAFGLLIGSIDALGQGENFGLFVAELALGGILAWILTRREIGQPSPVLPVDLLRIPIFALSIATSIASFMAQMLALVSLPFMLHGLGFAGALGDIGLDAVHALASLAGFNLGVELGQVLFLAMVLAVIAAVRRVGCAPVDAWLAPLASGVAAVLGVAMLVGRIFAAFAVAN